MSLSQEQQAQLQAFAAKVRHYRLKNDLTQEQLAERVGINPRTEQKIEAGKVNVLLTTFLRIQKSLGCGADDLLPVSKRRGKKTKAK